MHIKWNENPLLSEVILGEHDKQIIRLKIIIEELENRIYGACVRLRPDGEYFSVEKALQELNVAGLEDEPFNKRINQRLAWAVEAFSEEHCGDCICQPCSCSKCHAEGLLDIDTIAGLGKHQAHKIESAFKKYKTIGEVISSLENYDPGTPGPSWKGHEAEFPKYVPRWKEEAKQAAEWLRKYKADHFS